MFLSVELATNKLWGKLKGEQTLSSNQKCRVCGAMVSFMYWGAHVKQHKVAFCKAIGRVTGEAWKINWEDVVAFYHPERADKEKCTGYPQPLDNKLNQYF